MRKFIHFGILLLVTVVAACGGDSASISGPHGDRSLLWDVSVFPRTASIPVDSTLQLSVKALDYDENELTKDLTITYESQDESSVKITPNGLITGVRSTFGGGVDIKITVQSGQVKQERTIYIGVTDEPVQIDSMVAQPLGPPVLNMDGFGSVRPRLYDTNGNQRDDVFALSELKDGQVDFALLIVPQNGFALVRGTGKRWVYSTAYVGGKLFQDSVEYTLLDRNFVTVQIRQNDSTGTLGTFMADAPHDNVHLQKDGQGEFTNQYPTPVDIIFANPDAVTGGNIIGLAKNATVYRTFPVMGNQPFTVKSGTRTKTSSITVTSNQ